MDDITQSTAGACGARAASAAAGVIGLFLLVAPFGAQVAADRPAFAHSVREGPGIPTTTITATPTRASADAATAIRPFSFHVSDEQLAELRRRIAATRWPEKETVTDQSQGVPLATMQELARYWATDYDWRKAEAKLNALPQFITSIDGLDIHFIHVRSQHKNALAADHHPRLARLGARAAQAHRSADRSDRARRDAPRTRSTSSFRRCRATASPASRPAPAGAPSAWPEPGPS